MRVLVNGVPREVVDALDRGLHYGDGLFETLAVASGRLRFLDWHLERLADGARRLGFPPPDLDAIRAELADAAGPGASAVKLVLTRGGGPRGYRPPREARPTRVVIGYDGPLPAPLPPAAGLRVGWCRLRLGRNPALAGLKHTSRLEHVLARAEWDDGHMDEGLMQDAEGRVVSATQANLFARIGGRWVTPRLDGCGVAGIMRRAFREWLKGRGSPAEERPVPAAELASASAIVLTNALIGARPVRELAGRALEPDPDVAAFAGWLERL
jgi:4-amino-4-deoxychorismate lyase